MPTRPSPQLMYGENQQSTDVNTELREASCPWFGPHKSLNEINQVVQKLK
jgi:hypothetical protein